MLEYAIDSLDNLKDLLTRGALAKRLLIALLAALPFVLWFFLRALPGEVHQKIAYFDESMNAGFADGAARHLAPVFQQVDLNGSLKSHHRDQWIEVLGEGFETRAAMKVVLHQESTTESYLWTGLSALTQSLQITRKVILRGSQISEDTNLVKLSWKKKPQGWFVYHVKMVD